MSLEPELNKEKVVEEQDQDLGDESEIQQPLTAAEIHSKINKLEFYLKKVDSRLKKHALTLKNAVEQSKRQKDLMKAGLTRFNLDKEGTDV